MDLQRARAEMEQWHQGLRPLCGEACRLAGSKAPVDTVLFYLARWCQKRARQADPDPSGFDPDLLAKTAADIVGNLDAPAYLAPSHESPAGAVTHLPPGRAAELVDRLYTGEAPDWDRLGRELYLCARRRVHHSTAGCLADDARQRIGLVLLTGTPPALAPYRLASGEVEGAANEYLFTSPFWFWAFRVVINMITDHVRDQARAAPHENVAGDLSALCQGFAVGAAKSTPPVQDRQQAYLAPDVTKNAILELPGLLVAMDALPPKQRAVMAWTLMRVDVDPCVREHLRGLAQALGLGLFDGIDDGLAGTDEDIAGALGAESHQVAANRWAAREKLARRNPYWHLLLDSLMPHRRFQSPMPSGAA